ncbi:tRNA (adenine-N(1))-methyltransferase [Staphylococcus arlettae]|uniref:Methyltransferase n=2 Tax=Staphylococcus arlettae TaxID=29378 RepID=A0A2T7BUQ8_9STAP|nr:MULTISPECIES: tRNA (adenine(22)-N(1))-methyltransferase TrmK [Staphylococcus]EJY95978.1 methyltransferase [Staphylococcus arlettae CVD059]ERF47660.1 tRNA methyltransferase [Staphylococcus sp. EGD-HP3]MBF0737708.1 tRNA (adenine-N(1))-methyltransferase [Staphylococcus arlettae]MCD8814796.1 tRNA (adenine(22)-N(1))-methyltransferase TrmK [Staphylococcus arlettae]MCD8833143.1 tRNA (adenine(22)-N(1))-methyltransferase TrmK [Staphylococcus arlettae]
MIQINQRLKKVSEYIKGDYLADIGSDHAYLPIYAIENNLTARAIAGEVIRGPFDASVKNVRAHGLESVISVELGDGLTVLKTDNAITSITICGMGGPLITKILRAGQEKLTNRPRLILQSNIQSQPIRVLLQQLNYTIVDEVLMTEKGHTYEIIVADYSPEIKNLSLLELKFGPILLSQKSELFYQKWERELTALEHILTQLNQTTHRERITEIENEIQMIKEVL